MLEWTTAGDGARLGLLVLHDDAEREFAYGPANGLPDTKVGTFSQALMDSAKAERLDRDQHEERLEDHLRRRHRQGEVNARDPRRGIKMKIAGLALLVGAAALAATAALAQEAKPNTPLEKTIGQVTPPGRWHRSSC